MNIFFVLIFFCILIVFYLLIYLFLSHFLKSKTGEVFVVGYFKSLLKSLSRGRGNQLTEKQINGAGKILNFVYRVLLNCFFLFTFLFFLIFFVIFMFYVILK